MCSGRLFQMWGPATEKTRVPTVDSLTGGMWRRFELAEIWCLYLLYYKQEHSNSADLSLGELGQDPESWSGVRIRIRTTGKNLDDFLVQMIQDASVVFYIKRYEQCWRILQKNLYPDPDAVDFLKVFPCPKIHLPVKSNFHEEPISSFYVRLLADRQTDRHTSCKT